MRLGKGRYSHSDLGLAWSHQSIILIAIDKVTVYLRERCWLQVRVGVEDFVVLHQPLRVIDTKGEAGKGKIGIDALVFLDWGRDYREWWATQSYGLLGGPIEPQVSAFNFCKAFVYISFILLKNILIMV